MQDLPGYIDLAFWDVDASDLVDTALADAGTKLPEWEPREGNIEVVLLEATALMVAETVYALNRLPGTVFEALLNLYGITRSPGTPTAGSVEFTLADTLGHTIPASTRVRVTLAETGEVVDLFTTEPLEVLAGSDTGQVDVRAGIVGDAGVGIAAGVGIQLIDAVPYVQTVTTATTLTGGSDPESDADLKDRAAVRLGRLSSALVLASHFTAATLETPGVGRALTVDLYDPATGPPGANVGHVTVVASDDAGLPLPAPVATALELALTGQALAGLAVHVTAPTVTEVPVTVSVTLAPGADPAAVQAGVAEALAAYLSPATWPWGATVWRNELISLIDRVSGVGRVDTLTAPAADVALPGAGPLASAGALTVTITAGL